MCGACGTCGDNKNAYELWWDNLKERNYFEYLDIGGSMILKLILMK
jgi:hypothetical protein